MKHNKSNKILVSIFFVFILVLSSVGTLGMSVKTNQLSMGNLFSNSNNIQNIESNGYIETNAFDFTDNIIVTNESYDETNPSIVSYNNNILVAYQANVENSENIGFTYSTDFGLSWKYKDIVDEYYNLSYPSLSVVPGKDEAYGIYLSDQNSSSTIYELEFQSLTNDDKWFRSSPIIWEDNGFYDFHSTDIQYYNDLTYTDPDMYNVRYIATFIGSVDYDDIHNVDTPIFFYRTPTDPDRVTIAWDPYINNCNNISIDMSNLNNLTYGVCEKENGGKNDIFFFNDHPVNNGGAWGDTSSISNTTFSNSENLLHPEIFVNGEYIYIVAETQTQGIIMYYSNDTGESFETRMVTQDILPVSSHPTIPKVYANDTHITCMYIESGNLSVTTSNDSGENWTTPIIINNVNQSVDSDFKNYDNIKDGQYVWTDTREGKKDLYYFVGYVPEVDFRVVNFTLSKDYDFPFSKTMNYINITVENIGDAVAEDIDIQVTYDCGDNKTETIDTTIRIGRINAGETITIKRPLFSLQLQEYFYALIDFAGLKNITVTLDPEENINDENRDNNVLARNTSANEDISYQTMFPRLGRFENFFEKLKRFF